MILYSERPNQMPIWPPIVPKKPSNVIAGWWRTVVNGFGDIRIDICASQFDDSITGSNDENLLYDWDDDDDFELWW